MNPSHKRLILAAGLGLLLLAGCDNAVRAKRHAAFIVRGDAASALYPVAVARDSENVSITLKDAAPTPQVFSIDAAGHATQFNATINGHVLMVPAKFERLELRHAGATPVTIVDGDTVK
ncbi:MAG: hypothetical protein H7Z39_20755 [Burkholderiaceae bacterium]|nr:hypothetical protein [Burkholderiaceae bacterium]